MVYKQIIHEGSFKRRLLRYDHEAIYFSFNYPKCEINEICFACEWVIDGTTKEITEFVTKSVIKAREKDVEVRCRSLLMKCEKQLEQKMEECLNTLKKRCEKLTELKMKELADFFANTSGSYFA